MGAEIADVYPDSIAYHLRLKPGDCILAINGKEPSDLIDLQWEWAGEDVEILVSSNGLLTSHTIYKAYDESLGVRFEKPVFDGIRRCVNQCLFCFVDQLPPGMRESLYIKDDDYRLSFLQGSYVTLTNLSAGDLQRIEEERLSPLYISVHSTDPVLRSKLLGRAQEDTLLTILRRLGKSGITFHCQIVLCPGYNDGEALRRTVEDLGSVEGVQSLSIVPVGLTSYRTGLTALRPVQKAEAEALIEWLDPVQKSFIREKGSRFVWLSDEFYVLSGIEVPADAEYEDYPQYENGVGMLRNLLEEAEGRLLQEPTYKKNMIKTAETECIFGRPIILAGATETMKALAPLWEKLRRIQGLRLEIVPLENRFFGPSVTVSGLLTGKCIIEGLASQCYPAGTRVYLPSVALKDTEDVFLDGKTVSEVCLALDLELLFLPANGKALVEMLLVGRFI